ncbi:MAG: phenylalanine--tRNA ligase subunit alpha, partial [Epsilonproteobacteria bacterium]|nr:phenylalanine--tRNA ligase subunit alpha [Campylobacterota bacterium]
MIPIIAEIERVKQAFMTALEAATTHQALEQVRLLFLSRQGELAALMAQLKELSVEQKRQAGPALNELRSLFQVAFDARQKLVADLAMRGEQEQAASFDVTAVRSVARRGSIHIYTQIIEKLEDIFISMGYSVVEGPEVETEFYNFDALNIPANHPARDAHDTFWLTIPSLLLRTHTSPVQIRALEKQEFPLAICAPGRVYRNEATDASHNFMFTQIEGLFIDKHVSMANLIATVETFLQAVFEKKDLKVRARPSYFPCVEPGIEIDFSCPFCAAG